MMSRFFGPGGGLVPQGNDPFSLLQRGDAGQRGPAAADGRSARTSGSRAGPERPRGLTGGGRLPGRKVGLVPEPHPP